MADKDLTIRLKLDKSVAEQESKAYHSGERGRIKETLADAQRASSESQQAVRAEFQKLMAERRREIQEINRTERESSQETNRAYRQAMAESRRSLKENSDGLRQRISDENSLRVILTRQQVEERARAELTQQLNRKWIDQTKEALTSQSHLFGSLKESTDTAGDAMQGLYRGALGFVGLQSGYAAINTIVSGLSDNMKRVADNTLNSANAYRQFRRATLEYQSITGNAVTTDSVRDTVKGATAEGLDPNYFLEFQRMMNEEAFGVVGNQFSQADFDKITKEGAAFSQARSLRGDEVAGLLGSLMRAAKPGAKPDDIIDQFGRIFNTLEMAPGATKLLMPELTQAMAGGMEPMQAARLTAIMAGRGRPRESGTYVAALERAIRNLFIRDGGRNAKMFGLTENMSIEDSSRAIFDRAMKDGVDINNSVQVGTWLAKHGITEQESIDSLRTMFVQGYSRGGVTAANRRMSLPGVPAFRSAIATFRGSEEGQSQAQEARTTGAEILSGEEDRKLQDALNKAREWYVGSGRSKRIELSDVARSFLGGLPVAGSFFRDMFGSNEDQVIRQRAVLDTREQARAAGVRGVPTNGMTSGIAVQDFKEIRDLLKKIEENGRPRANLSGGPSIPPRARP